MSDEKYPVHEGLQLDLRFSQHSIELEYPRPASVARESRNVDSTWRHSRSEYGGRNSIQSSHQRYKSCPFDWLGEEFEGLEAVHLRRQRMLLDSGYELPDLDTRKEPPYGEEDAMSLVENNNTWVHPSAEKKKTCWIWRHSFQLVFCFVCVILFGAAIGAAFVATASRGNSLASSNSNLVSVPAALLSPLGASTQARVFPMQRTMTFSNGSVAVMTQGINSVQYIYSSSALAFGTTQEASHGELSSSAQANSSVTVSLPPVTTSAKTSSASTTIQSSQAFTASSTSLDTNSKSSPVVSSSTSAPAAAVNGP